MKALSPAPVLIEEESARLQFAVGSVLAGKYRLERALGVGGMGAVWVALNTMTDAEVALKVLHEEVENPEALTRFRREAHLAAKLSHRGIVRVFDLVELKAGTLAMVMEILRGETLAERLDRERTIPPNEAIDITLNVASALAHAHSLGIVHRDLKPENVFLCKEPDGKVEPKILDFGISKMTGPAVTNLTTDGTLLGTPGYMSPEQARGDEVDGRSDLFALGILLYEMISGDNPFTASTYNAVIAAILERDPEPLAQLPPEVWAVVERVFEKRRAKRFASAADFASALRLAAGLPSGNPSFAEINTPSMREPPTARTPGKALSPAPISTASSAFDSGSGRRSFTQAETLSGSVLPTNSKALLVGGVFVGALALIGAAAALHARSSDVTTAPSASSSASSAARSGTAGTAGTPGAASAATTANVPPVDPSVAPASSATTAATASGNVPVVANGPNAASAAASSNGGARPTGGAARPAGNPGNAASSNNGAAGNGVTALTPPVNNPPAQQTTPPAQQTQTTSPTQTPGSTPASAPGVHTIKNPGF